MKKVFLFIAGAWMAWASHAEENKGKWWQDIKQNTTFGGYVIGKAAFNDQDLDNKNESHSTFDIRLIRAVRQRQSMGFQIRASNGNERRIRKQCGERASRIGRLGGMGKILFRQSKVRPVQARLHLRESHESLGYRFRAYSQATTMLAGMNDRVGEHSCNGRDLGLQVQGDLFKLSRRRSQLAALPIRSVQWARGKPR